MFSWVIKSKHGDFEIKVDDEDKHIALSRKWSISKNGNYIRVEARINRKIVRLHRLIMGVTDKSVEIDHINRIPTDNRKSNLRIANRKQNMRNVKFKKQNKTGYIGVYECSNKHKKYKACLSLNDKTIHIRGSFYTAKEAAIARDKLAYKLSGEFAILNFPHLIKKEG